MRPGQRVQVDSPSCVWHEWIGCVCTVGLEANEVFVEICHQFLWFRPEELKLETRTKPETSLKDSIVLLDSLPF